MQIDYQSPLTAFDGSTFTDERGNSITVLSAIMTTCSVPIPGDDALSMVEKYRIGETAAMAYKEQELAPEQVVMLKERSAKVFTNPVLVFILHTKLNG